VTHEFRQPRNVYAHHGTVLANGLVFEPHRRDEDDKIEFRDLALDDFAKGSPVWRVTHGRFGLVDVFTPFAAAERT
jgi:hypothetical protein